MDNFREHRNLAVIVEAFEIGTLRGASFIQQGLIHQTFQINTGKDRFCLQRLHPKLATHEILQDYYQVTKWLASCRFPAPELILTPHGEYVYRCSDGYSWRLTTWLEGKTYCGNLTLPMIRSASSLFGRFHREMERFNFSFQSSHPLHQTHLHLVHLERAIKEHINPDMHTWSKSYLQVIREELPKLFLPDLPLHVVHGDPKISNVLFDKDLEAIGLLDLDTCSRHSLLVDLGDAIRSWCCEGREDSVTSFSLDKYKELLKGYALTGPKLVKEEIAYLPQAGRLITIELMARFLTDLFEDSYFGWDERRYSSRREHNMARIKAMCELSAQMKEAHDEMVGIVMDVFAPVDKIE